MSSLYHHHRPQKWEGVTGQDAVKRTIQQEIKDDRLVHAYLFAGPRGVGKTSVARIVAKAVNCTARAPHTSEPCNQCVSCQEITAGRALDVLEIDAASHTGVDHVREAIIENARFSPTSLKYKVYIIDEVHMLSLSAFNALLKIIEEPPARVLFILATTELDKVPDTVISRCQRFDFKKIPHTEMMACLADIARAEKKAVDNEVLERIARQSEGCMRDAESLLGQLFALGEETITAEMADLLLPRFYTEKLTAFLEVMIQNNVSANLELIHTLAEEGVDLSLFHNQLIEFIRLVLLAKFNPSLAQSVFQLDDAALTSVKSLAARAESVQLSLFLEKAVDAKKWWKYARIIEIPLELLILGCAFTKNSSNAPASPLSSQPAPAAAPTREPAPGPLRHSAAETHTTPSSAAPASPITRGAATDPLAAPDSADPSSRADATPTKSAPSADTRVISLDEIKKKWNDLVKRVQGYHHSLPVILRMGEPLEVVGNVVRVGLKYSFHRDKIKERKMSDLVERALQDVHGMPLFLEPVTLSSPIEAEAHQEIGLEDIIHTFGGHVAPSNI